MANRILIILFVGLLTWSGLAGQTRAFHAQGYFVRQFTARDGLPGTSVADMVQDELGFLWLATHDGLARYDGYTFEVFRVPEEQTSAGTFGNFFYALHLDQRGYLWAGTLQDGLWLFDPRREMFLTHFTHDPEEPAGLCSQWIKQITEDEAGNIWVAADPVLHRIQAREDRFEIECFYSRDTLVPMTHAGPRVLKYRLPRLFPGVGDNPFWFFGREGGVQALLPRGDRLAFREVALGATSAWKQAEVTAMASRRAGGRWAIVRHEQDAGQVENHLGYWDAALAAFTLEEVALPPEVGIDHLYEDEQGTLWFGTWGQGLYYWNPALSHIGTPSAKPLLLEGEQPIGNIWTLLSDGYGSLWVGTWRGHLYQIQLDGRGVQFFSLAAGANTFAPGELCEDEDGNIWCLSAEGRHLFRYEARTEAISSFAIPLGENKRTTGASPPLAIRDGKIWIGDFHRLIQFDPETSRTMVFPLRREQTELPPDWIRELVLQGDSLLWCGTDHGSVFAFDFNSRTFQAYHEEYTNLGGICDLALAGGGVFAVTSRGVHRFSHGQPGQGRYFELYGGGLDLEVAADGTLWMGSYLGGLRRLDEQMQVRAVVRSCEEASLVWTTALEVDQRGQLWLMSPEGLLRYSAEQGACRRFAALDRFVLPKRASRSGKLQARNGRLYFSTEDAVVHFHPREMAANPHTPRPVLRQILVGDEDIRRALGEDTTAMAAGYRSSIELSHAQNDLTIHYAGLQYDHPAKFQYRYQLAGWQAAPVEVGGERVARFSALPPGDYVFKVWAANGDGVWCDESAQLLITIRPPWWRRWWAYLLYALLLAGAIGLVYAILLNRRLALAEARRLQEVDELKSRLYANVTHEFRTPLTVINGMMETAERQLRAGDADGFSQSVKLVKRNVGRMLELVRQLLDLAKIRQGSTQLHYTQADVVPFFLYLSESFQSLAESKGVQLVTYSEVDQLLMDFDSGRLQDVVANLLSNAVKFSPVGGKVIFHIGQDDEQLVLKVKDDGPGIGAEHLPHIFDRFYRGDAATSAYEEGTGIGLALVKEWVALMEGEVEVQSKVGKGSTFTVRLPVRREAPPGGIPFPSEALSVEETGLENVPEELAAADKDEAKPTLLLVEDNPDVLTFLRTSLRDQYQLLIATNGEEGLAQALEHTPDLILSDVLMPKMSGFALCKALKNNEQTSHIPVILLTAKVDEGSKVRGLREGADAYLAKPFSSRELRVRLRQLLLLRQRLQERYQQAQPFAKADLVSNQREDAFIRKLQVQLETHLGDETFGVQELVRTMGMSRSQVFKKVKALTGLSISQYVRKYRVHRARQLLLESSLSVSEVAYAVGFKDPAYFSRVYSEVFGHSPSDSRK